MQDMGRVGQNSSKEVRVGVIAELFKRWGSSGSEAGDSPPC